MAKTSTTRKETTKKANKKANNALSIAENTLEDTPKTKVKNTAGRPPKMSTKKLIAAAYEYMESTPIPNVTEFALQQGYERTYIYERAAIEAERGKPELSNAIKMISQLKEVQLEKMTIVGACPPNFAIFALKQLGWTDKVEQKIDADIENENSGVIMIAPVLEKNHEPEEDNLAAPTETN